MILIVFRKVYNAFSFVFVSRQQVQLLFLHLSGKEKICLKKFLEAPFLV